MTVNILETNVKKKAKQPEAKPEPMMFEHVPVKSKYDTIAERVMAATNELNEALKEAHECSEMRVFLGAGKPNGHAMRYEPVIYRLSHATLTMMVKIKDEPEMAWQIVKSDDFKDAAGAGFGALKK